MKLRRVQSAPANLSEMVNRPKKKSIHLVDESIDECSLLPANEMSVCEQYVMDEIVSSVASDLQVADTTEQLLLTIFVKRIMTPHDETYHGLFIRETMLRIAISFLSHNFMIFIITMLHNMIVEISPNIDQLLPVTHHIQ